MSRAVRRPDPPPLETDDVRTVALGTLAWGVGLAVLVVLELSGTRRVETWWMLMCVYGILLGMVGIRRCQRRRRAAAHDREHGLPPRP